MQRPTVSAVIPVFNGAQYVAQAIDSVLSQTLPVTECIIVDDGSTDDTRAVVAGFGDAVTYMHQGNAGVSAARNRGAQAARGEFLAFLDHDDRWLPEKLARQLDALAQTANAALSVCALAVVDADGRAVRERRLRVRGDLATGMLMFDGTEAVSCSSSGVIARAAFTQLGGFDERLGTSADWELLLRASLTGAIAYVDDPLVLYRVHDSNMSRNVHATELDMRRAYDIAFAGGALSATVRQQRRRAYARLYRMLSGSYRDVGDLRSAVRAALIALRFDPLIAPELIPGKSHRSTRVGEPE